MNTKVTSRLEKIITLGLTLVLPKVAILFAAYLLSQENYSIFNKFYYSGALLIIWGTLGFEFALNSTRTKYSIVAFSVLVNVLIASLIMSSVVAAELNLIDFIVIGSYAFFTAAVGILSFRILFLGRLKAYFFINLVQAIMLLLVVILGSFFSMEGLIIGFAAGPAFFFLGVFIYQNREEKEKVTGKSITDLYSLGFSSFIINSIVPLLLAADKFLANNMFDSITANSYTFAWTITAPLFYIGNVFEKMVYSSDRSELRLKSTFLLNGSMIVIYSLAIIIITNWVTFLLPKSIDAGLVRNISLWMLLGYSLYAIMHFPINGYLFKTQKETIQKSLAGKYIVIGLAAVLAYYWFRVEIAADYKLLLLFNFSVLTLLIAAKVAEIWGISHFMRLVRNGFWGSND